MLQKLNTVTSSNFEIVKQNICANCGYIYNVMKIKRNGVEETVDGCIKCETKDETKALETKYGELSVKAELNKDRRFFEKYSLIPGDIKTATFDNYLPDHATQEDAKKKVKWFAERFDDLEFNSLLLQGSYGLGKSHLAYACGAYLNDKGYKVLYIDTPTLLRLVRQSYSDKQFSESDIYRFCERADLLILDDLGAEYVKSDNGKESWASDVLFQIVNSRNGKPKLITTNSNADELTAKYGMHGGRIVSRILKGTKIVKFEGQDYRLKGV